ncbi:MAG: TrmH family RNA methyltransferase [Anaerolineales bacterium]|nr:TrmH family RNA methyltransferase [Anaerolineales bacterium]
MPPESFNIHVCIACGLRYPLIEGHSFGVRCPHCLGETKVVLKKNMGSESMLRQNEKRAYEPMLAVLMDNIRSAWNVGSVLRSADGFGFAHAYLCGITPTPEVEAVRKTALGAEEYVTWSHHKDAVKLIKGLKKEGWQVRVLEDEPRAIKTSRAASLTCHTVLIIGNEITGVDPDLLTLADEVIYIPMRGEKRSFNVANAFSIAAFALVEQKR